MLRRTTLDLTQRKTRKQLLIQEASKRSKSIFSNQNKYLSKKGIHEHELEDKFYRATMFYYENLITHKVPVPFLARYRKDLTKGLSEADLYRILYSFEDAEKILAKREEVLDAIDEDTHTPLLETQVNNASTIGELDQLLAIANSKSKFSESIEQSEAEAEKFKKEQLDTETEDKLMQELEAARREYFSDAEEEIEEVEKGENKSEGAKKNDKTKKQDEANREERRMKRQMQKLRKRKQLEEKYEGLAQRLLGVPLFRVSPSKKGNNSNYQNSVVYEVTYETPAQKSASEARKVLTTSKSIEDFAEIVVSKIIRQNPEFVHTFLEAGRKYAVFIIQRDPRIIQTGSPAAIQERMSILRQHHCPNPLDFESRIAKHYMNVFPQLILDFDEFKKIHSKVKHHINPETGEMKENGIASLQQHYLAKLYDEKLYKGVNISDTGFFQTLTAAEKGHVVKYSLSANIFLMTTFLALLFRIFFHPHAAQVADQEMKKLILKFTKQAINSSKHLKHHRKGRNALVASIYREKLFSHINRNFQVLAHTKTGISTLEEFVQFIHYVALQAWLNVEKVATEGARADLLKNVQEQGMEVYKNHIMMMMMQRPMLTGTNDRAVLAVILGSQSYPAPSSSKNKDGNNNNNNNMIYKTVATCAVVDRNGSPLKTFEIEMPSLKELESKKIKSTTSALVKIFRDFGVKKILVGESNHLRMAVASFFSQLLSTYNASITKPEDLLRFGIVAFHGGFNYCSTQTCKDELSSLVKEKYFPCVHLARRALDPISELVKMSPRKLSSGFTNDHSLVPEEKLTQAVKEEIGSVIVNCGIVDMNNSSPRVLEFVPGMTPEAVEHIVKYKKLVGAIKSREELKKIIKDDRVWNRVAGFLRCSLSTEPFDRTTLHPMWYSAARRICKELGVNPNAIIVADKTKEQKLHQASPLLLTASHKLSDSVRSAIAANELARARATASSGSSSQQAKEEQESRIKFALQCQEAFATKFKSIADLEKFKTKIMAESKDQLKNPNVIDTIIEELCLPQIDLRDHLATSCVLRTKLIPRLEDVKVGAVFEGFVTSVLRHSAFVEIGTVATVMCPVSIEVSSASSGISRETLKTEGAKFVVPYSRVFVKITQVDPGRKMLRGQIDLTNENNLIRSNFASNAHARRVWDSFVSRKKGTSLETTNNNNNNDDDDETSSSSAVTKTIINSEVCDLEENLKSQQLLLGFRLLDETSSSSVDNTANAADDEVDLSEEAAAVASSEDENENDNKFDDDDLELVDNKDYEQEQQQQSEKSDGKQKQKQKQQQATEKKKQAGDSNHNNKKKKPLFDLPFFKVRRGQNDQQQKNNEKQHAGSKQDEKK